MRQRVWKFMPLVKRGILFASASSAFVMTAPQVHDQIQYPENLELLQVQVVHRHGDRAPMSQWMPKEWQHLWKCDQKLRHAAPVTIASENQENESEQSSVCYPGQLTPLGKEQMRRIGRTLRSRYIDLLNFLDRDFNSQNILARSTSTPRTEESIQNVFAGLYPESQAPSIITHSPENEPMLGDFSTCLKLKELAKAYKSLPAYIQSQEEKKKELKKLFASYLEKKDVDGNKLHERFWPLQLWDLFAALQRLEPPIMPEGCDETSLRKLEDTLVQSWFSLYEDKAISKLTIGRLVDEMVGHAQTKISGKSDLKMIVYSGHDTTIGPLLGAYEVFDSRWPPIASTFVMELFAEKLAPEKHHVRFIYNNKVLQLPQSPSEFCPWETFSSLSQELIPKDYHEECGIPKPSKQ